MNRALSTPEMKRSNGKASTRGTGQGFNTILQQFQHLYQSLQNLSRTDVVPFQVLLVHSFITNGTLLPRLVSLLKDFLVNMKLPRVKYYCIFLHTLRSINQSIDRSIDRSINQSINQSKVGLPRNRATGMCQTCLNQSQ